MKTATLTFVAALCLAGCHADRAKEAPTEPAPSTSPAPAKADKSFEKSRDAMLGKNTDIQSQHWATMPAASSTSAAPASAKPAPSVDSSPAPASSAIRID
ncbi:hypothetical protein [Frateuria sp. Soil773]|uniref:hypothetical protein n=1 Tax=Frateuria sp. Soil773 TaxID=1736407 RepID=UPI000A932A2A|nr:hypothetical protein [Frateuria sp. Soil773]